jgi:hypothetical protein
MVTKTEVALPTPERQIAPISPNSVVVDLISHRRKEIIVELDPGLTLQDLNDHASLIWKLVQRDRNRALAPNDKVELRSVDWTATALVNSIDGDAVYLYAVQRHSRPQRTVALYEDTNYRIAQVGLKFAVFRKGADEVNPHGGLLYDNVESAKTFLLSQYPRKVGGR